MNLVMVFVCLVFNHNNKLIGVIGIQKVKDVILIRHAYTLTSYQGKGTGSALLEYLLKKNQNSRLLVGTWRKEAIWAIRFYKKFDFILQLYYLKNIGKYHQNKLKIQ